PPRTTSWLPAPRFHPVFKPSSFALALRTVRPPALPAKEPREWPHGHSWVLPDYSFSSSASKRPRQPSVLQALCKQVVKALLESSRLWTTTCELALRHAPRRPRSSGTTAFRTLASVATRLLGWT